MSTPSYSAFVRRHRALHEDVHAEAESIAEPAPDWIDLLARGFAQALEAALHLNRRSQRGPFTNDTGTGRMP